MVSSGLEKNSEERRLRNLLVLFFLALAVPTSILIWQTYSQLKWEAFHQYRNLAEQLTGRIDAQLKGMIETAGARSFADYTFLVVSGEVSANFVQRSPLSAYPVATDFPGALGYFQVEPDGTFSTPLLPPQGMAAASVGIGESEYADRLQLAMQIQAVLADNRLVRSRQPVGAPRRMALPEDAPATKTPDTSSLADDGYSQVVFDKLNQAGKEVGVADAARSAPVADEIALASLPPAVGRFSRLGKVSELKLDAELRERSEKAERDDFGDTLEDESISVAGKRKEQIALPETVPIDESEPMENVSGFTDLRIRTFESEIDPFEFSLLDSGHFVLFRKGWRDGERYIQGLLLEPNTFIEETMAVPFRETTALSAMSSLIIAYQDDVLQTSSSRSDGRYASVALKLDGTLLDRSRLPAPLGDMELIFSIQHLPAGAGAGVLGWVTLVLAIVLVSGFAILYTMGLSQINLTHQQQNFVSAVSHELKSPLTSIRMYGEMLKEGWVDDDKRQSYYEFIHDESERLSRLISNVLQLAKITRNEPQFNVKIVKVADLLRNIESKVSNQIDSAGFELSFNRSAAAEDTLLELDEDCFAQIIINLVDNAIKFSASAEKKVIEISSDLSSGGFVLFSVRDYGPGIARSQMKKIFQLFYRPESELTRETVGTGIGLAIVHQLTLAMKGRVDMINAEPGADFRLRFPIVLPT